jgi:endonuclease YncB( thermonuclease family)
LLFAPENPDGDTLRVPVVRVFDGDGFLTRIQLGRDREVEASVRFGFIDAPEMDQAGGPEARDFLNHLIAGQWLDLIILTKMDTGGSVDRHGRIVAVPYLQHAQSARNEASSILTKLFAVLPSAAADFRNIELEMVLNGWAWVLDRYEPEARYFEALKDAQRHRRGIWAREDNIHPWEFKRAQYGIRRDAMRAQQRSLHESQTEHCPRAGCVGKLVRRSGKYGDFLGCSEFPKCRHSRNHFS